MTVYKAPVRDMQFLLHDVLNVAQSGLPGHDELDPSFTQAILDAAGLGNVATDYGIAATTPLPLELLVMARPDRLITGAKWPGQSRGEAILDHPALAAASPARAQVTDLHWTCGTPFVTRAIRSLR